MAFAAGALLQFIVLSRLDVFARLPSIGAPELLLATVLQDIPMLVLALLLARVLLRAGRAELGLGAPPPGSIRRGALAGIGAFVLSIPLVVLQQALFGSPPQDIVVTFQGHQGLAAYLVDVVSGVLIAPFTEELLFRGILFAGLRQRMPFLPAAAISALAFVAPHGFSVALPIFAIGMLFARIYDRERSLYAVFASHATFNFIGLTLAFLAGGSA